MAEAGFSLSSLLLLAGIAFVVVRYFLSSSSSQNGSGTGFRRGGTGQRVDIGAIEQVASMFPQLDRRAIAWDLQRNGGSPQASVERMLTTGRLDTPPPSFQPQGLNPPQAANAPGVGGASKGTSGKNHPDLITRYKLAEKLRAQEQEQHAGETALVDSQAAKGKSSGWSANKNERASMLQQRREAMILTARRKMEEKDRREVKGKGKEVIAD